MVGACIWGVEIRLSSMTPGGEGVKNRVHEIQEDCKVVANKYFYKFHHRGHGGAQRKRPAFYFSLCSSVSSVVGFADFT